jgi:hypothetical protein
MPIERITIGSPFGLLLDWQRVSLAIMWLAIVGCGSREFYPVSGKVVAPDGAALVELAGTLIVFESADGRVSSQGSIEADGGFRMGTLASADGMRPGVYRVLIAPPRSVDGDEDLGKATEAPKRIVAPRYHSFATSGWEVTVEPKPNAFTFTAERATGDRKQ